MSLHTTSRISRVASFVGLGLGLGLVLGLVGLGLGLGLTVCIYVECLYTWLRVRLAMCMFYWTSCVVLNSWGEFLTPVKFLYFVEVW